MTISPVRDTVISDRASPVTGDPRKLILVRHSMPAIVPGVPACEWTLSDHGRQCCHTLAAMLAAHTPDIVVSSLEPKAIETGQIVASLLGKPFATAPGLHEHKRRGVEFSTREEFEARMAVLLAHPTELVMGSETAEQAGHRFAQAIACVLDSHPGDNVAVVTHGTVMSLYVAQVAGVEPLSFWQRLGLPSFVVLARPAMELLAVVENVSTLDYNRGASEYARHRQVHPGVLQSLCQAVRGTRSEGLSSAGSNGTRSAVLEVGCGTGNYILALVATLAAAPLRCACWGIDPSAEMLAVARREGRERREGKEGDGPEAVHFLSGRAEHLGFAPATFDLVFSVDVIHHVGDRARYLCEAYRALKTGGQVCTVTDSEWVIRHRQPLATYFPETVEIELARYPRIAVLREMMAQAGFGEITEDMVAHPYRLTDMQAYRGKAYSALHLISEEAFQKGIARMERDLCVGPIPCVSRYILLWGKK